MTEYLVVKEESPSGIGDEVLCKTTSKDYLKRKVEIFKRLGYKIRVFSRPVSDWAEMKKQDLEVLLSE